MAILIVTIFAFLLLAYAIALKNQNNEQSHHNGSDWLPSRIETAKPRSSEKPNNTPIHWHHGKSFEFEVVGESNYQRSLSKFAKFDSEHNPIEVVASLILEDWNKYDNKAVCVQVNGETVGYLSRQDARSYRRRLSQRKTSDTSATVNAIIVGGGRGHGGQELMFGIFLDMKPFS